MSIFHFIFRGLLQHIPLKLPSERQTPKKEKEIKMVHLKPEQQNKKNSRKPKREKKKQQ